MRRRSQPRERWKMNALEPRICEGSSLHHSGARRQNSRMRARALSLALSLAVGSSTLACGGDYWLGGSSSNATSSSPEGGGTASPDGGGAASPDGGTTTSPGGGPTA